MSSHDWRWKINEAVDRIRSRYEFIGRKTGAPFLALVYPPEVETAALKEWRTQTGALRPEIDVRSVDAMEVTQRTIAEFGAENIVSSMANPMPGSDPEAELGRLPPAPPDTSSPFSDTAVATAVPREGCRGWPGAASQGRSRGPWREWPG